MDRRRFLILAAALVAAPVSFASARKRKLLVADTIVGYGISQGNIVSNSQFTANGGARYVKTARRILGAGKFFRSDCATSIDSTTGTGYNWTHPDAYVALCVAAGLTAFLSTHYSSGVMPAKNGLAGDPVGAGGMMGVYQFFKAVVLRYGPGGTYALANPGFAGLKDYEVWNEPNTPTGNAGRVDDAFGTVSSGFTGGGPGVSLDIAPLDYALILLAAAKGLEDGWTALGAPAAAVASHPVISGFSVGTVDVAYVKAVVDAAASAGLANPLGVVDRVTCHIYDSDDPALPGETVIPTYNPVAGQTNMTYPRRAQSISLLRSYIDSATPGGYNRRGNSSPRLGRTEGGYAGNDTWNSYKGNALGRSDIEWATQALAGSGQHSQEDWNLKTIDTYQTLNAAGLGLELLFHYRAPRLPIDIATTSAANLREQSIGLFADVADDTILTPVPYALWSAWAKAWTTRNVSYGYQVRGTSTLDAPWGTVRVSRRGSNLVIGEA